MHVTLEKQWRIGYLDRMDVILILVWTAVIVTVAFGYFQEEKKNDEEIADIKTKINEMVDNINRHNKNVHDNMVKLCSLHYPDCEAT